MGTRNHAVLAAIDMGTSKVAVLVAERAPDGALALLGGAQTPSRGVRRGVVVDLQQAAEALAAALDRAEADSGQAITTAFVALSGTHISARNVTGSISLLPAGRDVTAEDLAHAILNAREEAGDGHEILHLLPTTYMLDGQDGIHNPLGMAGGDLRAEVHVVSGAAGPVRNLTKCLRAARVEPEGFVFAPLAAAEGVLDPGDPGCYAVADIGAATVTLAIYTDGAPWRSVVLPQGAHLFTRDLAAALRLPHDIAEALKRRYGTCDAAAVAEDELVEALPFTQVDEVLPRRLLADLLATDVAELAEALLPSLRDAEEAGVVPDALLVTGGGAALEGVSVALQRELRLPVRFARPSGIAGMPATYQRPEFAVAAGLLRWGARQMRRAEPEAPARTPIWLPRAVETARQFFLSILS